jgi:hypothetical protein
MKSELAPASWRAYLYEGTDTLINKMGVRDAKALSQIEADVSAARSAQLYEAARLSADIPGRNMAPITSVFKEISVPERAIAFRTMAQSDALKLHPELGMAYKALHQAQAQGLNLGQVKTELVRSLDAGDLPGARLTGQEAHRLLGDAAQARGLDLKSIGGAEEGRAVIVATTGDHALIKGSAGVSIIESKGHVGDELKIGRDSSVEQTAAKTVSAPAAEKTLEVGR